MTGSNAWSRVMGLDVILNGTVEIITWDIQRIREYLFRGKIIVVVRKGDRMTNVLAIRILTGDVLGTKEQTQDAIKMAVKALSQPDVPDTNVGDTISRQAAIDAVEESRRLNHHQDGKEACAHEYEHRHFLKILMELPSAQPDDRLKKIADIVEGTIDHFDLDDAMDVLYQIKEVLK